MVCRRLQAPLSATIHTIQATHSQCHTLLNSYNIARPPLLRSHLLQYRRLMLLHPQVLFQAHCYHAVQSAHKSLRVPLLMSQVMKCRSLMRSRSSHSLSSYSAAASRLLPFQPPRLPVPISPLDAAVQTTSPCEASQEASTQTSDQPVSSLSFDVAVQTMFHSVRSSSLDRCRADDPTQFSFPGRFYADGFSPSFLVFC